MKRHQHILSFMLFLLLLLQTFPVSAAGAKSWYCMRQKNHERPPIESDFQFIEDYDGVYLGRDEKKIYLTFDAGYENGNIERILDTLQQHHAVGNFFILKNLLDRNPDLVKRMQQENHLVCNHSLHHKDITRLSPAEIENEVVGLDRLYLEKTGCTMAKFFRPPEGKFDESSLQTLQNLGYTTVFWSLAYADWDNNKQPSPDYAKNLLLANIHNGAVVLLHPTSKTNADILDGLLTALENDGYTFGSLTDFKEGNK